jgi:TolB protein
MSAWTNSSRFAAAVATGLCAGEAIASATPPPPVQVTHGFFLDPSFSPDGKRMVLISMVDGKEQLFIMNVDGSDGVQLTNQPFDHEDPAWSPTDDKIAFVSMENEGRVIHVMNIDGSHDEALTPAAQKTIHPFWSPDGQAIIYCTDDDLKPPAKNSSTIYAVDVKSRAITELISGGVNTYGAWSPDRRHIAFRKIVGALNVPEMNSEVFLANGDGSNLKNLTNDPAFDGWPAWSPDGRQIAFGSNRKADVKNYRIWVMKADGSDVRLVADTKGRATAPQWTKDGRKIYFPNCSKTETAVECEVYASPVPPAAN